VGCYHLLSDEGETNTVGDPVKKLMPRPTKPVSSSAEKALRRDAVDHQSVNVSQTILGVEERIQGSQVNLETASEFSKKSWRIHSQLVSDHVRETSTDRYDLSDRLLRTTRNCLGQLNKDVKAQRIRSFKAADILAAALCRAAQEIGPPSEEPDEGSDYWVSGRPIWGSDHPISEAWAGLGQQKVPWVMEESLRFNSGTGKWDVGPARLGLETVTEVDASINTGGFFLHDAPPAPDYTDPLVVC